MFVPEKGWNSGYIHDTLCLCQRRGGTLAIFMKLGESVFVPQKRDGTLAIFMKLSVCATEERWNSGYIHETLCLCQRRDRTLCV